MSETWLEVIEQNLMNRMREMEGYIKSGKLLVAKGDYLQAAVRLQSAGRCAQFDELYLNILDCASREAADGPTGVLKEDEHE